MKMNKTIAQLCVIGLLAGSVGVAIAGNDSNQENPDKENTRVEMNWVEPKKFTDLRERTFSTKRFRERVFTILESHFEELAAQLPEGQSIKLTITDIDLAGRVEPAAFTGLSASAEDVRIMRDIDIPRMNFEYTIVDGDGNIVKQEDVKIKDMNYLNGTRSFRTERPLGYEKRMITRWFEKNILQS
jgi:hypothetical protein